MSNDSLLPPIPILTPCIGICRLDSHGYCEGCFRSVDEITRWRTMPEAERQHLMDVILPARESV